MKKIILLMTLVASTLSAAAQATKQIDIGADEIVTLWDNSTAKYSNHMEKDEKVVAKRKFYNTSSADLYIFHPKSENRTGVSIVIYPGGSYRYAGFSTHFINWCKENGITAAMLKYRVPNGGHNQATLEDATGAVEYMRANADRLGIDPTKVGVAGCSAGGHLAAWVSNAMADDRKPAFAMLFCGSMLRDAYYVTMSANMNLMGKDVTPAEAESLTLTNLVTKNTPPTLILLCHDDNVVRPFSSTKYYTALKRHGVPASMHIYPSGGHSWWSNRKWEYRNQWLGAVKDWLDIQTQPKQQK